MSRKSSVITLALFFIPLLLIYFVTVVYLETLHHNGGESSSGGNKLQAKVRRSYTNSNVVYQVLQTAPDNHIEEKDEIIDCSEQLLFGEFNGITLNTFNKDEIESSIQQHCLNGEEKCQRPSYKGFIKIKIDTSIDMYNYRLNYVNFGGWWSPTHCLVEKARKVAIIVPYSNDDEDHLGILLNNLHPVLRRQQLHYRIFVVRHKNQKRKFCKGHLMNAGFLEVNKLFPYTCFVFHDVDLLPLNDRIDYACSKNEPTQLSVLIDENNNGDNNNKDIHNGDKIEIDGVEKDGDRNDVNENNNKEEDVKNVESKNLFGRVVSFRPKDFRKLQGFPNNFCSNNHQDEIILYKHLANKKLKPVKESFEHGRFTKLKHKTKHASVHSHHRLNIHRSHSKLDDSSEQGQTDSPKEDYRGGGLKTISYELVKIEKRHYYTLLTIDHESKTFNFDDITL